MARMFLLLLLTLSTGCNVVALQEAGLRRQLRSADLVPHRLVAGPDRIQYWASVRRRGRPAVVLVHGFGAAGTVQWVEQVEALHEDYALVVPDLLWFGDSFSTDADWSLDHQVRAVTAVLDDLGIERASFVGVSYGGLVSYTLASTEPERAQSLVMIDSPGRAYRREDYSALTRRFGVERPAEIFVPDGPDGLERVFRLAYYDPPWVPGFALDQIYQRYFSRFRREQTHLLEHLFSNLEGLVAGPDYDGPALLVWGRHDPVFPLEIGKRLDARMAHSKLVVIEEAAHAPNVEQADEVNAAISAFLASSQ